MKKLLLSIALVAAVSGCSSNKMYGSSGGSKADGIVKMSYSYGMFESPVVDEKQGVSRATKTCAAWGFTGVAVPFDFASKKCTNYANNGCNAWIVTKEYQCN